MTHRDWASSFHVYTGNFKDEIRGLNFENLAQTEGTLIFLMGFANLDYITKGLIAAGKAEDTPVAVISNATTPRQKTAVGDLTDILAKVKEENLVSPAITVIGDVVKCREYLNFFDLTKEGVLFWGTLGNDLFAKKLLSIILNRRCPLSSKSEGMTQRLAAAFAGWKRSIGSVYFAQRLTAFFENAFGT